MEIAIEKKKLSDIKKLSDMKLINGLQWEAAAIQSELRGLQAAAGVYPMEIDRLTKEIQQLENREFTEPLDFEVTSEVSDDPKHLENERKRFLKAQGVAQQRISEYKAHNQREIERVKSAMDTYREERFARHEKEKVRIKELLQLEKVAIDRLNDFVILDVRSASV